MKTFFTADTHFYHRKINEYCPGRGFTTSEEHDQGVIDKWNEIVGVRDEVWVLGDFCFSTWSRAIPMINILNGHIHLVPGNHDTAWYKKQAIKDIEKITVHPHHVERRFDGTKTIMTHFPYEEWAGNNKGILHLHGHAHGNGTRRAGRIDVGWDIFHKPVAIEEIIAYNPFELKIEGC